MTNIRGITLSYVPTEDRIHMALRLEDDRTAGLWMTQRLARSLVRSLANRLEVAEGISLSTVRNAVMAEEQAVAVSNIRPADPVKVDTRQDEHLVREIKISASSDTVRLVFCADMAIEPEIRLDRVQVRQWLSMLHTQFQRGQWQEDVWPDWLAGNDPLAIATRH